MTPSEFLERVSQQYADITPLDRADKRPQKKNSTSLFIDGQWYECAVKDEAISKTLKDGGLESKALSTLDVQVLNARVLRDILGIVNVRTDSRIDFVGGSRGIDGLVRRCEEDSIAAFAMYPVTISELL